MAPEKDRPNLRDMTLEEIEVFLAGLGKETYRARQIMKGLYQGKVQDFDEISTLARPFRQDLARIAGLGQPAVSRIQTSADGTRKLVLDLEDGLAVEAVLIPGRNHETVCVSTQVGCRMGCAFCFTGSMGFRRNLRPSEIVGQVTAAREASPGPPPIRNIVLMGMGEPLDNYDHAVQAIRILTSDHGLGFSRRKITVSTCGLAPLIPRLGQDVSVNLAVSLNAPDDTLRNRLMPINRRYPLAALLDACRTYPMPGRRMLTFEYILMNDVNDAPAQAQGLARLLRGIRCKLNLIAFNPFPGSPFETPAPNRIASFQEVLVRHHYTAILRASHGRDILAACGQLAGRA